MTKRNSQCKTTGLQKETIILLIESDSEMIE